ncbi:MAG: pentapeptide repeat-containing protein, partial [Azonexaceae bacterium]|nr:pentapeptide repeat-containing protein [Azonexaceae bacterium]
SLRSALPISRQQAALESTQPGNLSLRPVSVRPAPQTKTTPNATASQTDSSNNCIGCHTSDTLLKQLVPAPAVAASSALTGTQATAYTRTMPLWQQVLVDTAFLDDVHAQPGCIACHGGTPNTVDFADAHSGLRRQASAQPDKACGSCHIGVAKQGHSSLHHMQWGIQKALIEHGADLTNADLQSANLLLADLTGADLSRANLKGARVTPAQLDWIRGYLIAFEQALYASSWLTATGTNHYEHYITLF